VNWDKGGHLTNGSAARLWEKAGQALQDTMGLDMSPELREMLLNESSEEVHYNLGGVSIVFLKKPGS
jgi:hypothetical protein